MLDGTPGGTVDTFRHNGFLKGFGIADNDPAIVGRANTNGAQDKGQTGMENLLSAHPDINVVYTINEPAAEGAYAAIKAAGKTKDIVLTSIDGGCLGVKYVSAGQDLRDGDAVSAQDGGDGRRCRRRIRQDRQEAERLIDTGHLTIAGKKLPGVDSKESEMGPGELLGLTDARVGAG